MTEPVEIEHITMKVSSREPEQVRRRLEAWIATQLEGASDVAVSDLEGSEANGMSSDTVLFRARWNDADGAWELVADLPGTACAITKHGNPCGAAVAASFAEAFRLARDADPISAFGGVVAFNGPLTRETAEALCEKGNKLDVIIATWCIENRVALLHNDRDFDAMTEHLGLVCWQ